MKLELLPQTQELRFDILNKPEVIVIDYGAGNLLSVKRGLEHCGASVILTADPTQILAAKRIILPGVGAFKNAIDALQQLGLVEVIKEIPARKIPLLGICLGMQLLFDESEEFGLTSGLGLIPGRVIPVPNYTKGGQLQKVPHIGWNSLQPSAPHQSWENTILQDVKKGDATYFVHSFMANPTDPTHRISDVFYGDQKIAAVIGRNQVMGCQFHPEKSGEVGLKILKKFISE